MSKLKEFRTYEGLTQEKFAELLGIKRRTYNCYEDQSRYPNAFNKGKILDRAKLVNFSITEDDLTRKLNGC